MNRGPAVIATAVALGLVNIGVASAAVTVIGGSGSFVPLWLAAVSVGLGVLATIAACLLWRDYLRALRDR